MQKSRIPNNYFCQNILYCTLYQFVNCDVGEGNNKVGIERKIEKQVLKLGEKWMCIKIDNTEAAEVFFSAIRYCLRQSLELRIDCFFQQPEVHGLALRYFSCEDRFNFMKINNLTDDYALILTDDLELYELAENNDRCVIFVNNYTEKKER